MEASARAPLRYGVCGIMVNKGLNAPCLDLDDPRDHVAVALAGLAHGFELIDDNRLKPDKALGFASTSRSNLTEPSGSVEAIWAESARTGRLGNRKPAKHLLLTWIPSRGKEG